MSYVDSRQGLQVGDRVILFGSDGIHARKGNWQKIIRIDTTRSTPFKIKDDEGDIYAQIWVKGDSLQLVLPRRPANAVAGNGGNGGNGAGMPQGQAQRVELGGFSVGQDVCLHSDGGAEWHNTLGWIHDIDTTRRDKFVVKTYDNRRLHFLSAEDLRPLAPESQTRIVPHVPREQGSELRIADLQQRLEHAESTIANLDAKRKRYRDERDEATQLSEDLAERAVRARLDLADTARSATAVLGQVLDALDEKELTIDGLRDQVAEAAEHVENSNLRSSVAIACSVVSTVGACVVALAAGVGL